MRRDLINLIPVVVAFVIVLNLPWWPEYERGLLTGAFLVAVLWVVSWAVWVLSGLGFRLNGVMAEDVTNEVCRKHPNALASLPSYKFPRFDVDTVLVTHAAVYAVETKWRSRPPSPAQLERDVTQLQRDVAAFRSEVSDEGIPPSWVRGLLVVRGPGSRGLVSALVEVGGGERIRVVSGADFPTWLDGQDSGKVGPDFAAGLVKRLRTYNRAEEERIDAGPVLRWLARAR